MAAETKSVRVRNKATRTSALSLWERLEKPPGKDLSTDICNACLLTIFLLL